jgi:xanthine dehydrogenase accessory factor
VGSQAAVLVSVIGARGSSPRGSGAKMIVTTNECRGSVGGGQLEYQCIKTARDMLGQHMQARLENFVLGTPLDQCCGGAVEVLFDPLNDAVPGWLDALNSVDLHKQSAILITTLAEELQKTVIAGPEQLTGAGLPADVLAAAGEILKHGGNTRRLGDILVENIRTSDFNIAVFGAGHVGSALVAMLAGLDADIRWIDDRENIFTDVPAGVSAVITEAPASEVAAMPAHSFYLVMTHSHELDLGICHAILTRGDAAYCGLIGSASKRRRFEKRLLEHGLSQSQVGQLVCPIGIDGIKGKLPAAIAIATAAEILREYEKCKGQEDTT